MRRTREIAEAWQSALAEGRRGEFGRAHEQLDRAERLAAGAGAIAAQQAVAAAKTELENRQKAAAPKVEALYVALSEGKWPQILSAAEAVLDQRARASGGAAGADAGLAADRRDRPSDGRAVAAARRPRGAGRRHGEAGTRERIEPSPELPLRRPRGSSG